jgi:hypothetical protein
MCYPWFSTPPSCVFPPSHSSPIETIVETGIPAHVLQQLELELHNPSPQKSQTPQLTNAPNQVDEECTVISDMCKQMMSDLSSQYRRNFIMNIARHKFTKYKAEENRIRRAKRLYDEKMKLVMTKAVDQFSTFYAQEMEKIIQVDSDSANLVGRMDSEDVFKRLQLILEEALKQLQAKMLNPSNPSQP